MRALPHLPIAVSLAFTLPLAAQGHLQWQPGAASPGPVTNAYAYAAAWWDPDGPGPRGDVLVVGGSFELPSVGARNLAYWDPATQSWGAIASPSGTVRAITVLADGRLVIGGTFSSVGATPASKLAVFDGTTWTSPGGGLGGAVQLAVLALQEMPNGDLVVGGEFTHAGGAPIPGIARWDGSQWHPLGVNSITQAKTMALRPNGNLIVGGVFPVGIAEWNGSGWTTLTPGLSSNALEEILVLDTGDVIAAGAAAGIWRWDGTVWTPLSVGHVGGPSALLPLTGGAFLAGRIGSINGTAVDGVMQWDGSQWTPFAPGVGSVQAMLRDANGDLLLVGTPHASATEPVRCVARWDGTTLRALTRGFDNAVTQILPTPVGAMVFGSFRSAAGTVTTGAAERNGATWSALQHPTLADSVGTVAADGGLWVTGSVSGSASSVYRRTGTGWQGLDDGIRFASALAVTPVHGVTVGCSGPYSNEPRIARWNGVDWVPYGAGLDWAVRAVFERASGELVAGGEFLFSGNTAVSRIARWDGAGWQPFGTGFDGPVRALTELPNGDLVAAGDFIETGDYSQSLGLIARWDGLAWQPLGTGLAGDPGASARQLLLLPNGDLLVGGDFHTAGGQPATNLARWDGTAWHAVDGGTDGTVRALALTADGDVLVGGNFARVGSHNGAHFAVLRSDLPASATAYGAGCDGAFGALVLEPADLPWLGATWRSVCYGIAPGEIGIDLYGLTATQSPLSALHPTAVGCDLLTTPVAILLRLSQGGALESTFPVPNDPSLIASPVFQQMLVAELDASLTFTNLASSNGLELQLGSY